MFREKWEKENGRNGRWRMGHGREWRVKTNPAKNPSDQMKLNRCLTQIGRAEKGRGDLIE